MGIYPPKIKIMLAWKPVPNVFSRFIKSKIWEHRHLSKDEWMAKQTHTFISGNTLEQ